MQPQNEDQGTEPHTVVLFSHVEFSCAEFGCLLGLKSSLLSTYCVLLPTYLASLCFWFFDLVGNNYSFLPGASRDFPHTFHGLGNVSITDDLSKNI